MKIINNNDRVNYLELILIKIYKSINEKHSIKYIDDKNLPFYVYQAYSYWNSKKINSLNQ
jgi:hypothetical protein